MKTDIIISFLIWAAAAVSCGKPVPTSGILEVTGGKVQGMIVLYEMQDKRDVAEKSN